MILDSKRFMFNFFEILICFFSLYIGIDASSIKNSYIAIGRSEINNIDSPIDCTKVITDVHEIVNEGNKRRGLYLIEHPVKQTSIGKHCFVPFVGDETTYQHVLDSPSVLSIENNEEIDLSFIPATDNIDILDEMNNTAPLQRDSLNISTGTDVNVYVVDTGCFLRHSLYSGRSSLFYNHYPEDEQTVEFIQGDSDSDGHGTMCAGISVGSSGYGVAPNATLKCARVFNNEGVGTSAGVIAAFSNIEDEQRDNYNDEAAVINLSLSVGLSTIIEIAVQDLADSGHVIVAAAGNSGEDACTRSPGRIGGDGVNNGVIVVGSTDQNMLRPSYFSNFGNCVDIWAPGEDIVGASRDGGFTSMGGTSFSAPHVTGAIASLLAKHGFSKRKALDELFSLAIEGSMDFSNQLDENGATISYSTSPNRRLYISEEGGTTPEPTVSPNVSNSPSVYEHSLRASTDDRSILIICELTIKVSDVVIPLHSITSSVARIGKYGKTRHAAYAVDTVPHSPIDQNCFVSEAIGRKGFFEAIFYWDMALFNTTSFSIEYESKFNKTREIDISIDGVYINKRGVTSNGKTIWENLDSQKFP